ncbi:Lipase 2 [Chryseobacterium nakagawai]|uniref:Alpha/beta hydrolase n=1 Tax=Chryseobacterium nakagawai TaxID=1241982 RepID=A0AAD0YRV7_CHRNA|nr:alpha/beta hydrolase [Chryseobacterium nakagawai]AZA93609.1 alpha/beta hydrolase [Chryseobacterium nakagawai]VEH20309.1 Lipase 2 [Chryseobacterium nakagawai]
MTLDKISQNFLAQMRNHGALPFHLCTPEQARIIYDSAPSKIEDQAQIKEINKTTIPVSGGEIDLFVIEPLEEPVSVIVFYHGGGWVIGKASGYISYACYLAKITNSIIVVADYRKAPENSYPIPANDAYETLLWVDNNMGKIAGKRLPLIVCGESAGGNLAAVTVLRAKDSNGPEIACQILACPITNHNFENESYNSHGEQLIISKKDMIWFWDHYVPDVEVRKNSYVSPMYAKNVSGLPRTVIITAEHDPLCQEGEDYAERLINAGVPVTFKRFEGQMHGFFTWVDFSSVSREAQAIISDVILNEVLTESKNKR